LRIYLIVNNACCTGKMKSTAAGIIDTGGVSFVVTGDFPGVSI
jgi:hypothetical protein